MNKFKLETIYDVRHLLMQLIQKGTLTIESCVKIFKVEDFRKSLKTLAEELKQQNERITNIF